MRMRSSVLLASIVALLAGFTGQPTVAVLGAQQQPPGQERVRVFIGFDHRPGASDEAMVRGAGGQVRYNYTIVPAIAATMPAAALNGLRNNPGVRYVEPDLEVTAFDVPPYSAGELNNAWGVKRIGSSTAWDTASGAGIKVAVIDSGIDYTHPDLAANYDAADSWDFVHGDAVPFDDNGHGTHVAGTIAAVANGAGVVGVAPDVRIMSFKVLDETGSGSWSDVIAGVNAAVVRGALVTNSSLGSSQDPGTTVAQAYANAKAAGVVNVVSAGNSGNCGGKGNNVGYPGRYPSVIAVAATDSNDKRPCFSSVGPTVAIAAPGVAVNSTVPLSVSSSGYAQFSGTSMASPHVAGVAALVIAAARIAHDNPDFTPAPDDVKTVLTSTALDLGASGFDNQYGYGLVQADAAVAAAGGTSGGGGGGGGGDDGGGSGGGGETTNGTAFVQNVTYTKYGGGKNGDKDLRIEVLVGDIDHGGAPIPNASVSVTITRGTWTGTGVATTTSSGIAAFSIKNAPSGVYTTTITQVLADGYVWTDNHVTWSYTK